MHELAQPQISDDTTPPVVDSPSHEPEYQFDWVKAEGPWVPRDPITIRFDLVDAQLESLMVYARCIRSAGLRIRYQRAKSVEDDGDPGFRKFSHCIHEALDRLYLAGRAPSDTPASIQSAAGPKSPHIPNQDVQARIVEQVVSRRKRLLYSIRQTELLKQRSNEKLTVPLCPKWDHLRSTHDFKEEPSNAGVDQSLKKAKTSHENESAIPWPSPSIMETIRAKSSFSIGECYPRLPKRSGSQDFVQCPYCSLPTQISGQTSTERKTTWM